MNNIKLAIFDVDGTLLDTSRYVLEAFEHALTTQNHEFDKNHVLELGGRPLEETYQAITGKDEVSVFVDLHRSFQKVHPELSFPFSNTISTLLTLKERNIKIAAFTSRAKDSTRHTLEKDHIYDLLDMFVTVEDVSVPKPDPEGIFKILEKLSLEPREAVMIGDTEADIMAGRNAKTYTAGALYGMKKEVIQELKPDFLLEDISDILLYV